MPLDPENLTPDASINRVRIVELPGVVLPEGIRSKTAFELCGLNVLATRIREEAAALGIESAAEDRDAVWPHRLQLAASSADSRQSEAAAAVCRWYGERLGYVLATLKRGDAANREARPEWDESYWAHWAKQSRIVIGGGLASGRMGDLIVEVAVKTLESCGISDCEVVAARQPTALPLIGMARLLPPVSPAMVFDFGQSSVKCGVATYLGGSLERLEFWPVFPLRTDASGLADQMARYIVWCLKRASNDVSGIGQEVGVAIASYIKDDHPFQYAASGYARLWSFTDNLGAWLSQRVSEATGRDVRVRLEHDCTAAAQSYAGEVDTAVVMLGTALGAGFPSRVRRAWPLAPGFCVVEVGPKSR